MKDTQINLNFQSLLLVNDSFEGDLQYLIDTLNSQYVEISACYHMLYRIHF